VETRRDNQPSRCAGANSPSEGQRAELNHQTFTDMISKKKYTVITIDSALHEEVRKHCDEHGLKIGFFANQALRKLLEKRCATTKSSAPSTASTTNE
jgi:hypothetical protein